MVVYALITEQSVGRLFAAASFQGSCSRSSISERSRRSSLSIPPPRQEETVSPFGIGFARSVAHGKRWFSSAVRSAGSTPVGMNLFVMKSVAPDLSFRDIYVGVVPFLLAQVVLVAILIAVPSVATWLPSILYR